MNLLQEDVQLNCKTYIDMFKDKFYLIPSKNKNLSFNIKFKEKL